MYLLGFCEDDKGSSRVKPPLPFLFLTRIARDRLGKFMKKVKKGIKKERSAEGREGSNSTSQSSPQSSPDGKPGARALWKGIKDGVDEEKSLAKVWGATVDSAVKAKKDGGSLEMQDLNKAATVMNPLGGGGSPNAAANKLKMLAKASRQAKGADATAPKRTTALGQTLERSVVLGGGASPVRGRREGAGRGGGRAGTGIWKNAAAGLKKLPEKGDSMISRGVRPSAVLPPGQPKMGARPSAVPPHGQPLRGTRLSAVPLPMQPRVRPSVLPPTSSRGLFPPMMEGEEVQDGRGSKDSESKVKWTIEWDEDEGAIYYLNSKTGESSWDEPEEL